LAIFYFFGADFEVEVEQRGARRRHQSQFFKVLKNIQQKSGEISHDPRNIAIF